MVRSPRYEKTPLKKGTWSPEEDSMLIAYIRKYGIWNWTEMPKAAGLSRTGKSCRLRWVNYLKPGIRRGNFTREEVETIIQMHQTLGNRWSTIASKLPGRTDNEIKNFWHTHLSKRLKNTTVVPMKLQGMTNSTIEGQVVNSLKENGDSLPYTPTTSNWEDFQEIPMSPLLYSADLSSSPHSFREIHDQTQITNDVTNLSELFGDIEGLNPAQSSTEGSGNLEDLKTIWREIVWPEKSSYQLTSCSATATNEKTLPSEGSDRIIPIPLNPSTVNISSRTNLARGNGENEAVDESIIGQVPEVCASGGLQDILMKPSHTVQELLLVEKGMNVDNSFNYHTYSAHQHRN
ncbi:hypothetical protein K2173_004460 [Erythroxylum novogranatense]|uniref:Uncharacterized protein n=1 Tax=Erythroxylum novogranatense TaxID=1862640 RepID=A0AAV8T6H1_9ROSI|nr:hypothetical protein K2173_004460 [Erythroxylum novogranatense]